MTIETKLSVGDTAFYMDENRAMYSPVESISITVERSGLGEKRHIIYTLLRGSQEIQRNEEKVFPSKEDLLKSL